MPATTSLDGKHLTANLLRHSTSLSIPAQPFGGGSGVTSQLTTARGGQFDTLSNASGEPIGSNTLAGGRAAEIDRCLHVLSHHEVANISEAFLRGHGGFMTMERLTAFLIGIGVQPPSGSVSALEVVVRRAVELQSVYLHRPAQQQQQPSHLDHQRAARASSAGIAGSSGALHRVATKVLSARRLSARVLSARSSLLHAATGQTSAHPNTSTTSPHTPLVPLPATLPLDLVLWVCRVLKDDLLTAAARGGAEDNPEVLEAYGSCLDESTGTVTMQSVREKCRAFNVVVSLKHGSASESGVVAAAPRDTSSSWGPSAVVDGYISSSNGITPRRDDVGDIDGATMSARGYAPHSAPHRDEAYDELSDSIQQPLSPSEFAALVHIDSTAAESPPPANNKHQRPLLSSGSPQQNFQRHGRHHQHRPGTAPGDSRSAALSDRSSHVAAFMMTPYSEKELQLFDQAESLPLTAGITVGGVFHSDLAAVDVARDVTNTLLGDTLMEEVPRQHRVAGSVRSHSGGVKKQSSSFRLAGRGAVAALVLSDMSPTAAASVTAAAAAGTPQLWSPGDATTSGTKNAPHQLSNDHHHHHDIDATLHATYFLPLRPSSALDSSPTLRQQVCARHADHVRHHNILESHIAATATAAESSRYRGTAAGMSSTLMIPPAVLAAGGAGQTFLERYHQRQLDERNSCLDVPSQAHGRSKVSLGVENVFRYDDGQEHQRSEGRSFLHDSESGRANHHLHGYELTEMVERQRVLQQQHPAQAALLGPYFNDLQQERDSCCEDSRHLRSGDQHVSRRRDHHDGDALDERFPLLQGLTRSQHLRSASPSSKVHSSVFNRLTLAHREDPSLSLYRLQNKLAQLEAPTSQPGTKTDAGGRRTTAAERLHRFNRAVSSATSKR